VKISCILVGKTTSPELKSLCDDYARRIQRYAKSEEIIIDNPASKITDVKKAREKEGEAILKRITPNDFVILLDDKGKEFTSLQFAAYLDNLFNQSLKNVCFVTGGAYGFSEAVYKRANAKLSLSKMTFSHQVIRLIFMEQLYRAFTIINKEPYHHE